MWRFFSTLFVLAATIGVWMLGSCDSVKKLGVVIEEGDTETLDDLDDTSDESIWPTDTGTGTGDDTGTGAGTGDTGTPSETGSETGSTSPDAGQQPKSDGGFPDAGR